MEARSLLSFAEEVAQFSFSILHLLLTHIFPLVAMLAGSFLLHIFRFITSLFFTKPSTKKPSLFQHSSAQVDDAEEELERSLHENCYEDCHNEYFIDEQQFSTDVEDSRSRLLKYADEGPESPLITPNHPLNTLDNSAKGLGSISQPSLFPSDLPPNLDDVGPAPNPTARVISMRPRKLPPSWSQIERILRESSNMNTSGSTDNKSSSQVNKSPPL